MRLLILLGPGDYAGQSPAELLFLAESGVEIDDFPTDALQPVERVGDNAGVTVVGPLGRNQEKLHGLAQVAFRVVLEEAVQTVQGQDVSESP